MANEWLDDIKKKTRKSQIRTYRGETGAKTPVTPPTSFRTGANPLSGATLAPAQAPSPVNPAPQQTTVAPYSPKLKDVPQFWNPDGSLNKKYDTSKGQDVMAGIALGSQMGMGQDPFFALGAILGGAVGGLVNKNLAGKQQYQQDRMETLQYNQQVIEYTNAEIRAQDARRRQEETDLKKRKQEWTEEFQGEITKHRTIKEQEKAMNDMLDRLPSDMPPEKREAFMDVYFNTMSQRNPGLTRDMFTDKYGMPMKQETIGDFRWLISKDGRTVEQLIDTKTGLPMTDIRSVDLVRIIESEEKKAKGAWTLEEMQNVLNQTESIIRNSPAVRKMNLKQSQIAAMSYNMAKTFVQQNTKEESTDLSKKLQEQLRVRLAGMGFLGDESGQTTQAPQTQTDAPPPVLDATVPATPPQNEQEGFERLMGDYNTGYDNMFKGYEEQEKKTSKPVPTEVKVQGILGYRTAQKSLMEQKGLSIAGVDYGFVNNLNKAKQEKNFVKGVTSTKSKKSYSGYGNDKVGWLILSNELEKGDPLREEEYWTPLKGIDVSTEMTAVQTVGKTVRLKPKQVKEGEKTPDPVWHLVTDFNKETGEFQVVRLRTLEEVEAEEEKRKKKKDDK